MVFRLNSPAFFFFILLFAFDSTHWRAETIQKVRTDKPGTPCVLNRYSAAAAAVVVVVAVWRNNDTCANKS